MMGRTFLLVAVFSLLLTMATIALWARSDTVSDNFYYGGRDLVVGFSTGCGHVRLTWERPTIPGAFSTEQGLHHDTYPPLQLEGLQPWPDAGVRLLGLRVGIQQGTHRRMQAVIVPLWMIALVSMIPWFAWRRTVARR